jgi:periplasmic protein TonB
MSETPTPAPSSASPVSAGWLGANSTFSRANGRRSGPAFAASLMLHGLAVLAVFLFMAWAPKSLVQVIPQEKAELVFVQAAGPGGGGGGGNKMPDPPRKLEMKAEMPKPPVLEPVTSEIPPPTLVAPIQTNMAVFQTAGSLVGLGAAPSTGSGSGTGSGPDKGSGVGPGEDKGFGGDSFREGNGATVPTLLQSFDPKYTTEAMRARIQGEVTMEVVVGPDGLVKDVRVVKSLDRANGLDEQAMKTARQWRFRPGMYQGKPVSFVVLIVMTFNLR